MKSNHSEFLLAYVFSFVSLFLLLLAAVDSSAAQTMTHAVSAGVAAKLADIVRDPTDVPPPIVNRTPAVVRITLTAKEVLGTLDPSARTTYRYWTFNGKVPGPMIRVRQGDTVEVTLRNDGNSYMTHSVDFHAALGPGGGAALSQTVPGQSKTFTFQATTSGLFVYHCGTPMIAEHMANGMYGLILVEPENGLPRVDREYYIMQGEIYTSEPKGKEGLQQFSAAKLMSEAPEYFVFNGAVDALTSQHPMPAEVGDSVRIFFGNAGPNQTSSTHMVGEIFTRVYQLGSLTSAPLTDIQTTGVPPGAAAILEFAAKIPGKFALMDHAISRMPKGNMAIFEVTGPENAALMHPGSATPEQAKQSTPVASGMTALDQAANFDTSEAETIHKTDMKAVAESSNHDMNGMMPMHAHKNTPVAQAREPVSKQQKPNVSSASGSSLNGCLTLASDGKAMLSVFQSTKVYRLEAQPFLFSQNANRLVHVSGYFGSVLSVEDPRVPSFVVSAVDTIALNCNVKISAAQIRKALLKPVQVTKGIVSMSDMAFSPQTLVIKAGEKIVWKNTSEVTHNVVADPAKALYQVDVKLPSGVRPFGSEYLQPGQSFSRVFEVPGIYRYVCTLHESSGMKGVIIVKAPELLRASE